MKVLSSDRQLALNLDLFELREVDKGAEGDWEGGALWLLLMGSLFTCLQGSQPSEWVSGTLLLGLVSEDPHCGIQLPLGPPLAVWDGTSIPQRESSLPEEHCSFLASHADGCSKWTLLLLYKPSFKIDYKMFLNLPNTH